jgi:hypothetical protein
VGHRRVDSRVTDDPVELVATGVTPTARVDAVGDDRDARDRGSSSRLGGRTNDEQ